MPDAARISDKHICPKVEPGPVPHVGGPIFSGSANVIIGYLPAARVRDSVVCLPVGPTDRVKSGSTTVLINHRAAARKTDPCVHMPGSIIVQGCPTVIIGDTPQSFTFRAAAKRGTPFCEECERKRQELDDHDDSATASEPPDPDTATLDDDAPPPGALAGRDMMAGINDANVHALARQPNLGDGIDGARADARLAVAYAFYSAHTSIKPSKITSHLRALDVSKPVDVIPIDGQTLYQRGLPGASNGNYFAPGPNIPPEQLGASTLVYPLIDGKQLPPPVPRDRRVVEFGEAPAYGLQSTAAAIPDDWSMPESATDPGQIVSCEGGAIQIMVPKSFHGSSSTTHG